MHYPPSPSHQKCHIFYQNLFPNIYILILKKRWNSIKLLSNSCYCLGSLIYLDGLNGHHSTLFIFGCCMNQHRGYTLWESEHVKLGLRWSEIDLFCNSSAKLKWTNTVKSHCFKGQRLSRADLWDKDLEKKIFRFCQCIFTLSSSSSLEKRSGPLFKQIWIPSPKRMLGDKFSWNWPGGSGEEDFQILNILIKNSMNNNVYVPDFKTFHFYCPESKIQRLLTECRNIYKKTLLQWCLWSVTCIKWT